jgi:hypothetical protein
MTLETSPSIVWVHRNETFLRSLDDLSENDVSEDNGLLGAMACYEIYLRMRDMYVAFALIRGDEADDCEHQAIAVQMRGPDQ